MGPAAIPAAISAAKAAKSAYDSAVELLPLLIEDVDVVVTGAPFHTKSELYFLAVAAAFGKISNRTITGLLLPKGHLMVEYNGEGNYVRFNVRQISTWDSVWYNVWKVNNQYARTFGPLSGRGVATPKVAVSVLSTGPTDISYGGTYDWYSSITPGLGTGDLPQLANTGWERETILTPFATYDSPTAGRQTSFNPYPDGDGISRGPNTIAADPAVADSQKNRLPEYLVLQALAQPCNPERQLPGKLTYPTAPNAFVPPVAYPDLLAGFKPDLGPTGPQPDNLPPL